MNENGVVRRATCRIVDVAAELETKAAFFSYRNANRFATKAY